MTALSLMTFALAMAVLAATPGPGVFATVGRALASGFRQAAIVVLGIVIGDLVFLLFAVYGLAAVAQWLGGLFTLVKYAGAAYLIWLGIGLWRAPVGHAAVTSLTEVTWPRNLLSGLLITLGNPKVILFYLGFLPAFIDLGDLDGLGVSLIALVVSVVLGSILLLYAYLAARARQLLLDRAARRLLNRTAGGVMIATGAVLAGRA